MAKVIGVFNKSRGSGKTVTTLYLAAAFRALGKKVATVDFNGELQSFYDVNSEQKISIGLSWKNYSSEVFPNLLILRDELDYILIDLSLAGEEREKQILEKLDSVIVPVEAEFFGLDNFSDTLNLILQTDGLAIEGILLTKCRQESNRVENINNQLKKYFSYFVFNTHIMRNYYLALPQFSLNELGDGGPHAGFMDYCKLAIEIIENEH